MNVPALLAELIRGMPGSSPYSSIQQNHSRVSSGLAMPGPPTFRPPVSGPWIAIPPTVLESVYPRSAYQVLAFMRSENELSAAPTDQLLAVATAAASYSWVMMS